MLQGEFDGGFDEAEFFADVIALPFEFVGEDALDFVQFLDRVCELDFAASADFLFFQEEKDFGREDVTADDREIGRSGAGSWFFYKIAHLEAAVVAFDRINDTVAMGFVVRDAFDADDR